MKHYCFNSNIYIYQKEAKWKNTEINTIRNVLKVINVRKIGLSIRLSNDNDVRAFNYKWKGINKPTNILSFANSSSDFNSENKFIYLGDIIGTNTLFKDSCFCA